MFVGELEDDDGEVLLKPFENDVDEEDVEFLRRVVVVMMLVKMLIPFEPAFESLRRTLPVRLSRGAV
jgi:hypothetical protein